MSPRSVVKPVVEGNFLATLLAMAYNTSSWHLLYMHWSKATLQLFRVWTRVCHSPQRGQESFGFFFQRWCGVACQLHYLTQTSSAQLGRSALPWTKCRLRRG